MNGALKVVEPRKIGPYSLKGTVGDGAFSVVKLVHHEETHQYYACKIVPKSRLNSESLHERFETEIRINQQMHHPGIVQLYELLQDQNNFYLIMEFCPNGELFQYIVDHNHLKEEEAKPFVRQILETLEYIHNMSVSHRDIKPENLLLSNSGQVKFSDFGLSRFIPPNGLVDTPCGSPCYASPECISGKPYNGVTTDVWSVGVILYAMLTGQLPWTKRKQAELFAQIKRGEYVIPSFLSDDCKSFIRGLMTVDCTKRMTIQEAFNHKWLRGTPVQFQPMCPTFSISLRMIDRYFGKEISEDSFKLPNSFIEKDNSFPSFNISKTVRLLKNGTNLPHISKSKSDQSNVEISARPKPTPKLTRTASLRKKNIPAPIRTSNQSSIRATNASKRLSTATGTMRHLTAQGSPNKIIKRTIVAKPQIVSKHSIHK
ncbi:CAMK family protein kinase [Histomonas meleagridis]|uniref:CAMK family protein kinase n=1 Tax=Histomonas meleagridis TaxID=135588 RepID=UPI00355995AD|nr:CAMK family protein kinase [Histomonas meleagridis]KAH0801136.1 CAMK family protein kinase [Histomonas meleagridis]